MLQQLELALHPSISNPKQYLLFAGQGKVGQ
jgi:hypothetical protein